MSKPYTTIAKLVLGAALLVFCSVLFFYAIGVGGLSRPFVGDVVGWSAIIILFVVILILPQARRRDEIHNSGGSISTTRIIDPSNGLKAIGMGAVLLVLSVVLFFTMLALGDNVPKTILDALSFVDTALLFFGALYLAAGVHTKLKRRT